MFTIAHTLTVFPLGFTIFKLVIFYIPYFILNKKANDNLFLHLIEDILCAGSIAGAVDTTVRKKKSKNHGFYGAYILIGDQTKVNN